MGLLLSQDNNASKRWTHAWRIRDKDVSANPFISSTTKTRARHAAAQQHDGLVKIESHTHAHSAWEKVISLQLPHPDKPEEYEKEVPCLRQRPSTGIARSKSKQRPHSSHSAGARVSSSDTPAHGKRPHGLSGIALKQESLQYVHPTIYKLMQYSTYAAKSEVPTQTRIAVTEEVLMRPEDYSKEQVDAVILLQRRFRGSLTRADTRASRLQMEYLKSLYAFKQLKQSQINTLFNQSRARDLVQEYLEQEAARTVACVEAMFLEEEKESLEADKDAQKELDELLAAQATAERELEEADEAEERMEKERSEMLAWKIKVDRSYISYMDTKKEFNIENDDDEEMLGLTYPIALREKKHYESIKARYMKEKEEYENSRAVLAKERQESHDALARSHKERLEWQESREKAKRERADIEVGLK